MNRPRAAIRGLLGCLSLLALAACDRDQATSSAPPEPSAIASSAPSTSATMASTWRTVGDHRYRVVVVGELELAITLDRPRRDDPSIVLAVAGTYTSPDDEVEGLVVIDGKVRHREAKPWEGLLVVRAGEPAIRRAPDDGIEPMLPRWKRRGVSLLQGHLLVHDGRPRPLKPSDPRTRRAIVTLPEGPAIVESAPALPLAPFAADLVALGATEALNLDMGGWSEGWLRGPAGMVKLGDDHGATDRQSNWVVLRR